MEDFYQALVTPTPVPTPVELSGVETVGIVVGVVFYVIFILVSLAVTAFINWKFFVKAGQPGWKCLVPIYNVYIELKIAGRPGWWLLLYLVPLVNIVIAVVVAIDLAKAFGYSATFGVFLMFFFGLIGRAVIGFGDRPYQGGVEAIGGAGEADALV